MFRKRFLKIYKEKLKNLRLKFTRNFQKEMSKFTCILNHDVKTPLLAQNQILELVLNDERNKLSNFHREMIKEVLNSNNFLLEIVSNMIFLSRYEAEKSELKLENVDIVKQIKDCCRSVENFAKEKQQNIVVKTRSKKINLFADKNLIQKIIFNLVSGSISSGFENSVIEVSVKENKNSILFAAKNKSVYMTKEKINSMFEDKKNLCDFNQLGMSLNLNIAKKLIEAHNWNIIAESKKDNSSTFGFVVKK